MCVLVVMAMLIALSVLDKFLNLLPLFPKTKFKLLQNRLRKYLVTIVIVNIIVIIIIVVNLFVVIIVVVVVVVFSFFLLLTLY